MVYSAVITLGASAVQITDASAGVTTWPAGSFARRVLIEPLRGNTHAAYVGSSSVTNNGTGVAIQELLLPATGVPLDRFEDSRGDGLGFDPGVYYVHGTSTEKVKATIWTVGP